MYSRQATKQHGSGGEHVKAAELPNGISRGGASQRGEGRGQNNLFVQQGRRGSTMTKAGRPDAGTDTERGQDMYMGEGGGKPRRSSEGGSKG